VVLVSFAVNVTVRSVFLQVELALSVVTGANVSILFTVIVKFTVEFSLSFSWMIQVSVHIWLELGV
jgi:hypothetical protein